MPDRCRPCRSGRCEDCQRLGLGCDCCGTLTRPDESDNDTGREVTG